MIKFGIYPNPLSNGEESYRAIVKSAGTLEMEDVIKMMIQRGSTVTEAHAGSVLNDVVDGLITALLLGYRVNTPFGTFSISIRGTFDATTDVVDPSRNSIELNITPSRDLRQRIQREAKIHREILGVPEPQLEHFVNHNNGDESSVLTPGGGAEITGDNLSFDSSDPNQGLFIISTNGTAGSNGEAAETRVEVVMRNMPSNLIFMTPAELAAGEYRLEVRALFGQELRTGRLKKRLTVA